MALYYSKEVFLYYLNGGVEIMELTAEDWIKINEAVKVINKPSEERSMRKNILKAIYMLIYYDFGDFCHAEYKEEGVEPSIIDPVTLTRFSRAFQQEYEYAYENQYGQMDYTKWCLNTKESVAFRESDIINNEVRLKTKFYNEFLSPRGLIYSMGCYIVRNTYHENPSAIALYRDKNQIDFSEKDLTMLKVLLPHIETRMDLNHKPLFKPALP